MLRIIVNRITGIPLEFIIKYKKRVNLEVLGHIIFIWDPSKIYLLWSGCLIVVWICPSHISFLQAVLDNDCFNYQEIIDWFVAYLWKDYNPYV